MSRRDALARRKRLGQYFTGQQLSLVLAHLAEAPTAATAIDPMAGSGDMLAAVRAAGGGGKTLGAIELDPQAATLLRTRAELDNVELAVGSAFDAERIASVGWEWDLVITNPPYVRYQNHAAAELEGVVVPAAAEVRAGLRRCIDVHPGLSDSARKTLLDACSYSGLSDLAVPSWLLACSLVREGGHLALVVPDTWLSRDYASPVLDVLSALFELRFVVEDREASWFGDASVRTTLVVARRCEGGDRALAHRRIVLASEAASATSLVGTAFPRERSPELAFAKWVRRKRPATVTGISVKDALEVLLSRKSGSQHQPASRGSDLLPERASVRTLSSLGWTVHQGLRTGANDFFYVKALGDGKYESPLLPGRDLQIDELHLVPAVRRQADLRLAPTARTTAALEPQWSVVRIGDFALREDAAVTSGRYGNITGDLEDLIRVASTTEVNDTPLPSLSAVRVNARAERDGKTARFWYHLPDLATRHRPDLFMARVNALHPVVYGNTNRRWVIDANFTTLVQANDAEVSLSALLAFLNSALVQAHFETSATVLGGGALKVEASHVRRTPVPSLQPRAWAELDQLGKTLAAEGWTGALGESINNAVADALGSREWSARWVEATQDALDRRTPRRMS